MSKSIRNSVRRRILQLPAKDAYDLHVWELEIGDGLALADLPAILEVAAEDKVPPDANLEVDDGFLSLIWRRDVV